MKRLEEKTNGEGSGLAYNMKGDMKSRTKK
jgi:hypothetical protein